MLVNCPKEDQERTPNHQKQQEGTRERECVLEEGEKYGEKRGVQSKSRPAARCFTMTWHQRLPVHHHQPVLQTQRHSSSPAQLGPRPYRQEPSQLAAPESELFAVAAAADGGGDGDDDDGGLAVEQPAMHS